MKAKQNTQNNMEIRSVFLELRTSNVADTETTRTLEGYASVFSENYICIKDRWGDRFYERICKGAFLKSIADQTRDKFMLVNHDWNRVIGRTGANLELREDEKGLYFKVEVPNTNEGNDLLENVRMKLIQGCSFGFNVTDSKTKWDDNGDFYRDITEVDLYEVTATTHPYYADTEINEARSTLSLKDFRQNKDNEHIDNANKKENEKRNNTSTGSIETRNMLLSFLTSL